MELNMCKIATTTLTSNEDEQAAAAAAIEQNTQTSLHTSHHKIEVIKDEFKDATSGGKGFRLEKVQEKKIENEKEKFKIENTEDSTTELLGSVTIHNCPGTRTSARVIQKMKQDQTRPMTPPPSERDHHHGKKDEKTTQKTPSQVRTHRTIWTNLERNYFFDALNEFGKDFEAVSNCINAKLKRRGTTDFPIKTKEQVRLHYYQTYHKICKYIKYSDEIKKPAQELYTLINYGEMRRKLQFLGEKHFMKLRQLVCQGHVTIRFKGKNIRIKTPSCKALRRLNQLDDTLEDIRLPTKIEVIVTPANMEAFGRVQALAQNPRARATVPLHKKLSNFIKTFQYKWRSQNAKLAEEELKLFPLPLPNGDLLGATSTSSISDTFSSCHHDPEICFRPKPGVHIHRPLLSITEYLSSVNICLSSYEERMGVKVRSESLSYANNKRQRTESGSEKRSPDTKKLKPLHSPAALDSKTSDEPTTSMLLKDEQLPTSESDSVAKVDNSSGDELSDELQELLGEPPCEMMSESHHHHHHHHVADVNASNAPVIGTGTPPTCLRNNKRNTITGYVLSSNSSTITTTTTIAISNSNTNNSGSVSNNKTNSRGGGGSSSGGSLNFKPLLNDDSIKSIRKGWTFSQAADITIGDLYVVLGQDSKLELEYYWRDETSVAAGVTAAAVATNLVTTVDSTFQTPATPSIVPSVISIQNEQLNVSPFTGSNFLLKELRKPETSLEESDVVRIKSLKTLAISNKLKHLLLIANLSERVRRRQCFCGHNCERNSTKTRIERDLAKTYISSSINGGNSIDIAVISDVGLFRQPAVPVHKPISIDPISQPLMRQKMSRHVLVQRRLLQPGRAYQLNNPQSVRNMQNINKQQQIKYDSYNVETEVNLNLLKSPAAQSTCDNTTPLPPLPPQSSSKSSSTTCDSYNMYDTIANTLSSSSVISSNLLNNNKCSSSSKNIDIASWNSNSSSISNVESDKKLHGHGHGLGLGQSMPCLDGVYVAAEPECVLNSTVPESAYDESTTTNFFNGMMSPMHLLRDSTSNSRWLEDNLNDFSLTSLLGHLDEINATRDILDPSSNMSVISESSVDYRHKFQEITALMQNQEKD